MESSFRSQILALTLAFTCSFLPVNVEARSQWDIQHPTLPPQQDGTYMPGQIPGQLHKGVPPQLGKNFWQGQHPGIVNRVQPGVVLTGTMETELSSAKNKPGDTFAINLEEGFVQNGMQVIPQKSKIIGAVTSVVPAKSQRQGQPGSIQVSLQSLVLPDGTHLPFSGFIAANPNHAYNDAPKKKHLGFDIKDTGSHMAGMLGSFTNGIGFMYSKRYRGNDFYLDEGESLPIRLNRTLIIPEEMVKPVAVAPAPVQPGATALPPGAVPGLSGPDSVGSWQPPKPAPSVPGLVGDADPFSVPVTPSADSKPLSEMPEPF